MKSAVPVAKDLVLVGGGHSHVTVLRAFGMKPLAGLRLTLISPSVATPYSGMLPGYIAGHYRADETNIDLGPLSRFANARLIRDRVVGLDLEHNKVLCADRPPIAFDLLSINSGSTPSTHNVPGAKEHSIPVKPVERFIRHIQELERQFVDRQRALAVGVVGAGAAGFELVMALRQRFGASGDLLRLHLIDGQQEVLSQNSKWVRRRAEKLLEAAGVQVHLCRKVVRAQPDRLEFATGEYLPLDSVIWATDAMAPSWLADSGLSLDPRGFVEVDTHLRSMSHHNVFAAGDVAVIAGYDLPRAGVYAVREGPPLAENLRRAATNRSLVRYRPQRNFLRLISAGKRSAIASRGRLVAQGDWVWRYKDWIDRRFMHRFNVLPAMEPEQIEPLPDGIADEATHRVMDNLAMRCRGCGAKVGQDVLAEVLQKLTKHSPGVHGNDQVSWDDAVTIAVPAGKHLVQSVDFLSSIVDDPYLFGRVAAIHALGDIYAMGATPVSALAIATLPPAAADKSEELLFQLMAGAAFEFTKAGASIVGGHTAEAQDLALGFTVNGLAEPNTLLRKGGLTEGDQIILCKPLGTGVLFAAEMRLAAKGEWIDAAIASLCQSNASAAAILAEHGVAACTDVTGFGLLGHLGEMLQASTVSAHLELSKIPTLSGALECVQAGIESSMAPQNRQAAQSRGIGGAWLDAADASLLFDPQTCGGLLAGVPADGAQACLKALAEAGYAEAAIIGEVTPADGARPVSLTIKQIVEP